MAYYSFVVIARQPVGIPKPMVMLDAGVNVFTVVVDDLDTFLSRLKDEGVTVQQMNRLDVSEPGSPQDLLVEGANNLMLPERVDDGIES